MDLNRRRFGLVALLAFEGGALGALHRLGSIEWLRIPWSDLGPWLEFAPAEDVLAAVLRQIGLLMAYWILGTTVVYLLGRIVHLPIALRSVEWATIPAVRRVVDGAVAVTIATASITTPVGPVLAESPPPVVVEVDERGRPIPPGTPSDSSPAPTAVPADLEASTRPAGADRAGWTPTPAGSGSTLRRPLDHGAGSQLEAVRPRPTIRSAAIPSSIVVEAGDHLWSISRRHLERTLGESVPNDVVAEYWRQVIDTNRDLLRSGDPDLIYPAETVLLPPIDLEDR